MIKTVKPLIYDPKEHLTGFQHFGYLLAELFHKTATELTEIIEDKNNEFDHILLEPGNQKFLYVLVPEISKKFPPIHRYPGYHNILNMNMCNISPEGWNHPGMTTEQLKEEFDALGSILEELLLEHCYLDFDFVRSISIGDCIRPALFTPLDEIGEGILSMFNLPEHCGYGLYLLSRRYESMDHMVATFIFYHLDTEIDTIMEVMKGTATDPDDLDVRDGI